MHNRPEALWKLPKGITTCLGVQSALLVTLLQVLAVERLHAVRNGWNTWGSPKIFV